MTTYKLANSGGNWFTPGTWNTSTGQPGQPGSGDTATITDGGQVSVTNAYLDGPWALITDPTDSSATGIDFQNSVLGGDSAVFIENGGSATNANNLPTINLSNSVLYGNVYAQQGAARIEVGSNTYGMNLATEIVGGIPTGSGGYYSASMQVVDGGTYVNYGGEYAFQSGTLAFVANEHTTITNNGVIAANNGGVVNITDGASTGSMLNNGSLVAAGGGTLDIACPVAGSSNTITDDGGVILLGGIQNSPGQPSIGGTGMLNLNAGRLEFAGAGALNVAQGMTTSFSGSSFALQFDQATSLSDILLAPSATGGHGELIVAASYSTGTEQVAFALDTAHAYSAGQFALQGNQVIYTATPTT